MRPFSRVLFAMGVLAAGSSCDRRDSDALGEAGVRSNLIKLPCRSIESLGDDVTLCGFLIKGSHDEPPLWELQCNGKPCDVERASDVAEMMRPDASLTAEDVLELFWLTFSLAVDDYRGYGLVGEDMRRHAKRTFSSIVEEEVRLVTAEDAPAHVATTVGKLVADGVDQIDLAVLEVTISPGRIVFELDPLGIVDVPRHFGASTLIWRSSSVQDFLRTVLEQR